jgi:hypothetical protein
MLNHKLQLLATWCFLTGFVANTAVRPVGKLVILAGNRGISHSQAEFSLLGAPSNASPE